MTHREETWKKAYKRLLELYGENPDLKIKNHLLSEKAALSHFGVAEYFDELAGICKESLDKYNEKMVVKNTVCSCLAAYLEPQRSIPCRCIIIAHLVKSVWSGQTKITVFLICEVREPANAVRPCELTATTFHGKHICPTRKS